MTIILSENDNPGSFRSKHWVQSKTADGRELLSISGIVLTHIEGTGQQWLRDRLQLWIRLPIDIPEEKAFQIEQWMPFITLNAIDNRGHAVNAGWAVDEFGGPGYVQTKGWILIWANIAVRDSDGELLRVGYSITLKGHMVDWDPPPPVK